MTSTCVSARVVNHGSPDSFTTVVDGSAYPVTLITPPRHSCWRPTKRTGARNPPRDPLDRARQIGSQQFLRAPAYGRPGTPPTGTRTPSRYLPTPQSRGVSATELPRRFVHCRQTSPNRLDLRLRVDRPHAQRPHRLPNRHAGLSPRSQARNVRSESDRTEPRASAEAPWCPQSSERDRKCRRSTDRDA